MQKMSLIITVFIAKICKSNTTAAESNSLDAQKTNKTCEFEQPKIVCNADTE